MNLPNPPSTGLPVLDRFLRDLVAFLRRPEEQRPLPTVLFADLGSVKTGRAGMLFQCPDHPDGYRILVTDGIGLRVLAPV